MSFYLVKILVTTGLIILISEIAKRNSLAGAILASIPLVSVLAMIWLYVETRDVDRVAGLSASIFWLVIPSLALFVSLPLLLKSGLNFYLGMALSIAITVCCYFVIVACLNHVGVKL